MNPKDRILGMNRNITRRDFLNGVAVTVGAGLGAGILPGFAGSADESYPPALTGIRGSHDGSFETAHALRDGSFWKTTGSPRDTGEAYDLIVVGGGISGLAAAYFYRKQAGPGARILILDNHDDFGGHAKRNEFRTAGRTLIGYGGTWAIDSPAPYSALASGLIQELGIDVKSWHKALDSKLYPSLGLLPGVFFDAPTFGRDKLVASEIDLESEQDYREDQWKTFLDQLPLAEQARLDLLRVYTAPVDYMPGLTSAEKKDKLARVSYADFLLNVARVHPDVLKFFQAVTHPLYGVGIDAVPAQDAWGLGMPGFEGMALDPSFGRGMNRDAMRHPEGGEAYFFHYPDGNATIARMLVSRLIPEAISADTIQDVVTAPCHYAKLDRKSNARIRLSSTVVRVRNDHERSGVTVEYARGGKLESVRAKSCILACWNTVIPSICPELPQAQKEDLAYGAKVPILYTNVLLSNWKSFVKAGVRSVYCPGSYHSYVSLDMPVSVGEYRCSRTPDEPIVIHMMRTPCTAGLPARKQHLAGRLELMDTSFETYERNIRDQLSRMLGAHGFDPARDIRAITVNRWAHGYAYQYNSLFDPFWLEGTETPCERARKAFGRIAIANADAAAYSYTDAAIDQAHRAVTEILAL